MVNPQRSWIALQLSNYNKAGGHQQKLKSEFSTSTVFPSMFTV